MRTSSRHYLHLFVLGLILYAVAIGVIANLSLKHQRLETGLFMVGQAYNGENYSHSLDLNIAAKAKFPSLPLTTAQNLGLIDGLPEKIVKFAVPVDRLNEYGLLMLPTDPAPPSGYPVIILLHGYYAPSGYETTTGYLSDMEFYARHGFAVIKPDLRGQGESRLQGLPEGAYYSMAYNTDVMSLISALKQTKYIDKSNISLWGHSMGAYIALRAAVLSPDIKNLILLSGPVGSLRDMYLSYVQASDENNPDALLIRRSVFHKYGTPASNDNFWNSASPINFVSRLKARVQIHVGTDDSVVPPKFSAQLNDALNSAHKRHDYYVYSGARHGLLGQRNLIWQRSLKALNSPD